MSIAPHRYSAFQRRGRTIATCEREGCGVQRKYKPRKGRSAVVIYREPGGAWSETRPPCVPRAPILGTASTIAMQMAEAWNHRASVKAVPVESRIIHVATAVIFGVGDDRDPHGPKGTCLYTQRPDNVMRPGMWEHPGGKLEVRETLDEAVRREAMEELGVAIDVDGIIGTICMDLVAQVIVLTAFACHIRPGEPTPLPLAAKELRWVDPQYAVERLACSPGTYPIHRGLIAWLEAHR